MQYIKNKVRVHHSDKKAEKMAKAGQSVDPMHVKLRWNIRIYNQCKPLFKKGNVAGHNRPESSDLQSQGCTTTKRNTTIRQTDKTDGSGFWRRKDSRYEALKQKLKAETNLTHDDIKYSKKETLAFMPERMSEKTSSLWYYASWMLCGFCIVWLDLIRYTKK